jgi:hypothetical protein
MDKKSMIFIMVKNVRFFGHDILYYYVKVWVTIVHDHTIFKKKTFKERKENKFGYKFLWLFLIIIYLLNPIQIISGVFIIYKKHC